MIFAIESNSLNLSFCILKKGEVIGNFLLPINNELSEVLIPTIKFFLKQNNISFKDISVLAVGCGPGSFTGIRTIIACAKAIIISNKHIKSIGINSLGSLAMSVMDQAQKKNIKYIISSIDSKRLEPFIQAFEIRNLKKKIKLHPINNIEAVKIDSLNNYLYKNNLHKHDILFVGHNQELLNIKHTKIHLLNNKKNLADALWVAKLSYFLINYKEDLTKSIIGFENYKPIYGRFADIN